jgi:predicted kinase
VETRQLIICRGIQGSGKSTWAKQWCHEDPENRIRFNNDDIRNMLVTIGFLTERRLSLQHITLY